MIWPGIGQIQDWLEAGTAKKGKKDSMLIGEPPCY